MPKISKEEYEVQVALGLLPSPKDIKTFCDRRLDEPCEWQEFLHSLIDQHYGERRMYRFWIGNTQKEINERSKILMQMILED